MVPRPVRLPWLLCLWLCGCTGSPDQVAQIVQASVTPNRGPAGGGTVVTIRGANFTAARTADFNQDGLADVVVSAPSAAAGAGEAFVFYSPR